MKITWRKHPNDLICEKEVSEKSISKVCETCICKCIDVCKFVVFRPVMTKLKRKSIRIDSVTFPPAPPTTKTLVLSNQSSDAVKFALDIHGPQGTKIVVIPRPSCFTICSLGASLLSNLLSIFMLSSIYQSILRTALNQGSANARPAKSNGKTQGRDHGQRWNASLHHQ
ncbi:hypothetical protein F2P81_007501 [Scophthalmus maximus]|uniref:MSP domain-containing protein n=1 Tax=Scophthalmus maximus TaxID=52904 RepID=A0A6A4SVJ8_SCOMX|nr:hypothetical protein F2P81_007501 [Scophthalmus maximus]